LVSSPNSRHAENPRRGLAHGADGRWIDAVEPVADKASPMAQEGLQLAGVEFVGLTHPGDVEVLEPFQVGTFDAGHQKEGQGRQKRRLVAGFHNVLAQRLDQAGGGFGDQLAGGQRPDGGQPQVPVDPATQPPGHVHRRSQQTAAAGDVHKQVPVPVARFDQGGAGQGGAEHPGHGLAVTVRARQQHPGVPAPAKGPVQGHVFSDPGLEGLFAHVDHRGAGGALGGHDHRPAVEPAVQHPLDGHGEVGDVDVNDRSFHN
jgi:hypothetical protein